MAFLQFCSFLSADILMISNPLSLYFLYTSTNFLFSSRQGMHQDAFSFQLVLKSVKVKTILAVFTLIFSWII